MLGVAWLPKSVGFEAGRPVDPESQQHRSLPAGSCEHPDYLAVDDDDGVCSCRSSSFAAIEKPPWPL